MYSGYIELPKQTATNPWSRQEGLNWGENVVVYTSFSTAFTVFDRHSNPETKKLKIMQRPQALFNGGIFPCFVTFYHRLEVFSENKKQKKQVGYSFSLHLHPSFLKALMEPKCSGTHHDSATCFLDSDPKHNTKLRTMIRYDRLYFWTKSYLWWQHIPYNWHKTTKGIHNCFMCVQYIFPILRDEWHFLSPVQDYTSDDVLANELKYSTGYKW